ncbi:penicillin-binding protein activator [Candidatus Colwellia aromaticivorans]|uniref:penicillin-binding protein activator n=1 Tax=Candidatus Colwellia aromaticivorans TaxID=2267621 RepID=UPI000DF29E09|nr:penicillin-binding protein activator [Candidatus Colwellia aromaticivorans]
MTRSFKYKQTHILFGIILLITFFLSGCSTQTPVAKLPTKTMSKKADKVIIDQTVEEKLTLAKSLNNLAPTPLLTAQINELLVESSELFLQQQDFSKALWLANKISDMVKQNHSYTYRLLLVKAKSLQALNYHQSAYKQLQLTRELVTYVNAENPTTPLKLSFEYYLYLQEALEVKQQPVKALAAELMAFSLNDDSSTQDVFSLWHKLESLNQWQLAQLVKTDPPFIKGWQQLLNYSHKYGANNEQFPRYLRLWEERYPTHPATLIAEQLLTSTLSVSEIENIAVLLPLSGSQKSAGLAAQQGILSAYKNDTANKIHFIDTNKIDWTTLATQFTESSIDHVIGPLLKSNVESYLNLSEQQIALQIPSLFLNLPINNKLASYQTALSMRPEDEAIQAAATLSQKNYKNPIVLSHQDSVSKRLAVAFSQQWQILTGDNVDIVYFNQGKQMQASLKEALDVNASQKRIKQLKNRLKNNIKSQSRNRRDIDMIYLIGSASQTRLVKPYIDVNTSPFASIIPVFASSRSHSNFDYNNNSNGSTNDLQGLTFTQMPWLLTSKQQNKNLARLSHKLWPRRTDSLSRIFAMGYDSYNLLDKAELMQQAPYIRHFGQTGVLKLNHNNVLTRSLIWGRYQNNKVMQIVME